MSALAPEHWVDLKKSGLTDETVTRCQIASVRPHDIKLKGVESAYRIPYFDLSGKKNCLERLKLFPPLQRHGATQKYHQASDTDPALYLPPLLDWAMIATQPISIFITEGEKKAACLAQHEIPCVGVAGVWNWRQSLDSGEKLVLPAVEQFVWTERSVTLIPDSDVWRPEKEQALSGFYALAQELVSRGARVHFMKLPEGGQGKVGLDDWMVATGGDWQHQWEHIERVPLDDPRLAQVVHWWQEWREKHANVQAVHRQDAESLLLSQDLDVYRVQATQHGVLFEFERVMLSRGIPSAEISVTLSGAELYSCVDMGLKSEEKQARLAKSLHALAPHVPWKVLLHKACTMVLKSSREGIPVVTLSAGREVPPLVYDVYPLVYQGKTTVLFGDGGLGKSTFALFVGMGVSLGVPILGMRCIKQKVLYLDYEDDHDTHQRRLAAIQEGHPELLAASVDYMKLTESLAAHVHDILKRISSTGCRFIVLDSVLCATGGDSSAEAATKLNLAFRKLNCSVLAIGHVAKGDPNAPTASKTIYGSVFFQNLARSTFEVQTHQEAGNDHSVIALVHRKHNLSRAHPSIGLQVSQDEATTHIHYALCDLADVPELEKALPLWGRIRNLLEKSLPLFEEDIAKELGEPRNKIRATLSRYNGTKWSQVSQDRGSAWTVIDR
jgi:hypothetical protein